MAMDYSQFAFPKTPKAKRTASRLKRGAPMKRTPLKVKPRESKIRTTGDGMKRSRMRPASKWELNPTPLIRVYADGRERCNRAAWAIRRVERFHLDGGRCVDCDKKLKLDAFDCDHKRKRSLGRDDRIENLKTLCLGCHRIVKHGGGK